MSKTQALSWAIVCGIVAVCCWLIPGLAFIGTPAMIVGLGFTALYCYKKWRHTALIAQAQAEANKVPVQITPTVTSPGSSRLFVPQPLDR